MRVRLAVILALGIGLGTAGCDTDSASIDSETQVVPATAADSPPAAPKTCSPLAATFDPSKHFELSYDPETGRLVFGADQTFAIDVNDRTCWERYPKVAKVVENVLSNQREQADGE